MPRITVTISSDLFDTPEQQASVREKLPVKTLLSETVREFNLSEDNVYALRVQQTGKLLDLEKTLEQQAIETGAALTLTRERRAPSRQAMAGNTSERQMISGPVRGFLRADQTGTMFDILYQPAVIGRPDPNNPASGATLAVNLGSLEGSKSVSRYHARITENDSSFYLESLADHNPAYLNESIVRVGEKRLLVAGDKVRVGKVVLTFGTRVQTMGGQMPRRGGPAPDDVGSTMIGDPNLE